MFCVDSVQALFYIRVVIFNGVQSPKTCVFHEMMTMNPSKLIPNEETVINVPKILQTNSSMKGVGKMPQPVYSHGGKNYEALSLTWLSANSVTSLTTNHRSQQQQKLHHAEFPLWGKKGRCTLKVTGYRLNCLQNKSAFCWLFTMCVKGVHNN